LVSGNGLKGRQPLELPENLRMVSRSVEPAVAVGLDPLTAEKKFRETGETFRYDEIARIICERGLGVKVAVART